jgi:hypothetical protein
MKIGAGFEGFSCASTIDVADNQIGDETGSRISLSSHLSGRVRPPTLPTSVDPSGGRLLRRRNPAISQQKSRALDGTLTPPTRPRREP